VSSHQPGAPQAGEDCLRRRFADEFRSRP